MNVSRSNLRERKRSVVSLEAMLTGSSSSENHLLYVLPDPQEVLEEQELQLEKILAFDNMQDRPIMGTSDWQQYEVVLDVSENGVQIAFGILLAGKGQVWLDEVQLELVSTPVKHA